MKRNLIGFGMLFVGITFVQACRTAAPVSESSTESAAPRSRSANNEVPGNFKYDLDISDFKGTTYLDFMKNQVKPGLDDIAQNGYVVGNETAIQATYNASGQKITRNIDGSGDGGLESIKKIARSLAGKKVTMADLPSKIHAIDSKVNQWGISTFIGLASGGGVKIKYAPKNYSLNIHYDVSEKKSGRSYGIGPSGGFNDISDKDYLVDLGKYAKSTSDGMAAFYRAMFMTLLNNDTSGYSALSGEGQTLLSNFLAVYTAEQDRNLMDGSATPYWDAALLEVTLVAGFHAAQPQFTLFYLNLKANKATFTSQTFRQTPCAVGSQPKAADMTDYWQFSRNITDATNCKRSGINITNREFRALGTGITAYLTAKHPDLVRAARTAMGTSAGHNLFYEFSNFLISERAPKKYTSTQVNAVTAAYVNVLVAAAKEAKLITPWIAKAGASGAMDQSDVDPSHPAIDDEPDQSEDVVDFEG